MARPRKNPPLDTSATLDKIHQKMDEAVFSNEAELDKMISGMSPGDKVRYAELIFKHRPPVSELDHEIKIFQDSLALLPDLDDVFSQNAVLYQECVRLRAKYDELSLRHKTYRQLREKRGDDRFSFFEDLVEKIRDEAKTSFSRGILEETFISPSEYKKILQSFEDGEDRVHRRLNTWGSGSSDSGE